MTAFGALTVGCAQTMRWYRLHYATFDDLTLVKYVSFKICGKPSMTSFIFAGASFVHKRICWVRLGYCACEGGSNASWKGSPLALFSCKLNPLDALYFFVAISHVTLWLGSLKKLGRRRPTGIPRRNTGDAGATSQIAPPGGQSTC